MNAVLFYIIDMLGPFIDQYDISNVQSVTTLRKSSTPKNILERELISLISPLKSLTPPLLDFLAMRRRRRWGSAVNEGDGGATTAVEEVDSAVHRRGR